MLSAINTQIERLKKDFRKLEASEQKMYEQERHDCIKGIIMKKQYLTDHITMLQESV